MLKYIFLIFLLLSQVFCPSGARLYDLAIDELNQFNLEFDSCSVGVLVTAVVNPPQMRIKRRRVLIPTGVPGCSRSVMRTSYDIIPDHNLNEATSNFPSAQVSPRVDENQNSPQVAMAEVLPVMDIENLSFFESIYAFFYGIQFQEIETLTTLNT